MSFGSGNADGIAKPKRKLLGLDELRSSSSEQAIPSTYLAGTARLGVSFRSSAFNVRHEPITSGEKKGSASAFNYFASFAAEVCTGPCQSISQVWFDDELAWDAGVTATGDSDDITIEDRGLVHIYWGTETQTVDPVLATSGENHPAYRGFCYLVFEDLKFGQGQTNAPNIEVVVTREIDPPAWFTAAATIGNDANPALVIWDIVTNKRCGLGIDEARLDTASLLAMGQQLEDEGFGMSVVVNRSQSFRQLLVEILSYVDGYYRNEADGTLSFGLIRPITDGTGLPVIQPEDITSPPVLRPGSWSKTANQAQVQFTNGDRYYKEDVISADSDASYIITGEFRAPVYSRPWITSPTTAAWVAQVLAQRNGVPRGEGSISLRKSSVGGLLPGDVFKLHWPQLDIYFLRCRVKSVSWKKAGLPEADIEFEYERGTLNDSFTTLSPIPAPDRVVLTPEPATIETAIELPPQLALDFDQPNVGFLVCRPTTAHDRYWVQREGSPDTYTEVEGALTEWATHGTVTTTWDGPGMLPLRVTLDGSDTTLATSGALLGSEDVALGMVYALVDDEFLLVTSATLVSAGVYDLVTVRAQLDSVEASHTSGADVWLFHRDRLPAYSIPNAHSTEAWKFQPAIAGRRAPLADCAEVPLTITWRSAKPPSPRNLSAFGDLLNPTYTTGQDITLAWSMAVVTRTRIWERWGGLDVTDTVRLVFLTTGGTEVATVDLGAGVESYSWPNADLVTALGSELSFKARVYAVRNTLVSENYSEIEVIKI